MTEPTSPIPRYEHWWEHAVVYQIYVRSFADADGDGIGDLEGLRSRLDYLAGLGVDAVWLCPINPSPQRDHGYDVSDYFDVEPDYGTLETFDQFVAEAALRGLRVVLDIVPGHSSDQHPWFQAARAAPAGSDERARYWFADGRGDDHQEPPNNWRAHFGGRASSWTPVGDGQWYLGSFTPYQPDWNHHHPAVQEMFTEALRFWFDRGVEGFRVDAVSIVGKAPGLPDQPLDDRGNPVEPNPYLSFRPEGHEVWRHWRRVVDEYIADHPGRDPYLVAEAYTPRRPDLLAEYTRPDEFHQSFGFDLMLTPWHAGLMRTAIIEALGHASRPGLWPTWVLNNHDTQRIVTRLGREDATEEASWTGDNRFSSDAEVDLAAGTRRARASIGLLLGLPGAVYLYMGEELGLPEWLDMPDEARQDPLFHGTGGEHLGRDGSRVPMPWTIEPADHHGFSDSRHGDPAPSWLPQPDGWGQYSVEAQDGDDASMLSLYRRLIAARRDHLGNAMGVHVDRRDEIVLVERGSYLVACNVAAEPVELAEAAGRTAVVWTSPTAPAGPTMPPESTVWWGPRA